MRLRSPGLVLLVAASVVALSACDYVATEPSLPFSKQDLRVGTGAEVTNGRTIIVHFQGWIHNADRPEGKGIQFVNTLNGLPTFFVVGAGDVITGLNLGVIGMREGGIRRLVIPPTLAYGAQGFGVIPPYSNLVYEIEVLEVI
jgi:FKBP-type peptidyl-prolyl cis-trans isomerase